MLILVRGLGEHEAMIGRTTAGMSKFGRWNFNGVIASRCN
jgi:hypothetical protein